MLRRIVLITCVLFLIGFTDHSLLRVAKATEEQPKNVILMIGDGMGFGQIEIARLLEHGKEGTLFMETLPYSALSKTHSNDNMVTDSAAAGTAIATGQKTNNGMVGINPNGNKLTSILAEFKKQGKTVGIVSTNSVTDATPAAFVANTTHRSHDAKIARQIFDSRIDIILGGGAKFFEPNAQNGTDLLKEFAQDGYEVVRTKDELNHYSPNHLSKLIGLFTSSHMNFIADKKIKNSIEPTLLEMSKAAIETGAQDKDGFFLMIEGARIDHAAHSADFTSIWKETIEFDKTVEFAVNWAKEDGDTLVVVLADHETMGTSATEMMDLEGLRNIAVSTDYMANQFEVDKQTNTYTKESIRDVFLEYANIEITDAQMNELKRAIAQLRSLKGEIVPERLVAWELGSIIANHYRGGVLDSQYRKESATNGHSANMVPIFSYGIGAERFQGVLDNTDIPKLVRELAILE
ncbi:alkaline phosphatase [Bacillus sp. FJAT-45350]|uniref:alkaline phosphatase n=1 Tax=Bacillus sp. FJAT-45350 TaxID=2011014 RepID=UPI00211BB2F6|nr:alkaline phosphatase [Bacillus sp. FJAT-45350]